MLSGKFIPVIRTLASQCDRLGITWAFTGSVNLVLWGFDLKPHDIDIETDRFGAERIDNLNAVRAVWPLHLRESDIMESWFARYDFDGVQVEVMGDCRFHQPDGSWVTPRTLMKRIHRVDWHGLSLPVLDLADEEQACMLMGRVEKAERIRTWLAGYPKPSEG